MHIRRRVAGAALALAMIGGAGATTLADAPPAHAGGITDAVKRTKVNTGFASKTKCQDFQRIVRSNLAWAKPISWSCTQASNGTWTSVIVFSKAIYS